MKSLTVLFALVPAIMAVSAPTVKGSVVLKLSNSHNKASQEHKFPIDNGIGREITKFYKNSTLFHDGHLEVTDASLSQQSKIKFTCHLSDAHYMPIVTLTQDHLSASVAKDRKPANLENPHFFCSAEDK